MDGDRSKMFTFWLPWLLFRFHLDYCYTPSFDEKELNVKKRKFDRRRHITDCAVAKWILSPFLPLYI